MRGPCISNFDFSVFRNVRLREGVRFQFGAEPFSTFNYPQFEGLGGGMGSTTFGADH